MLVEFQVGNFRSFKEIATFSLVAANLSAKDKELDQNTMIPVDDQLSLLTSAVVYGANASGKSNLIAAIRFMRHFVINSSRESQIDDPIEVEPFRLSEQTEDEPSYFQMIFYVDSKRYRYGFTVNSKRVVSEWLFHIPSSRESKLFERTIESTSVSSVFKEGREGLIDLTRENALFLSVVSQFNGENSQKIVSWFRRLGASIGLNDLTYRIYTLRNIELGRDREEIIDFVRTLDLGITDITIDDVVRFPRIIELNLFDVDTNEGEAAHLSEDNGERKESAKLSNRIESTRSTTRKVIRTLHQKYDTDGLPTSWEVFDMDQHESEGTKKLFAFAGPIIDTLKNGKILIVDELDARLHPLITKAIIGLFNAKETNPHGGQLIFTTHDTNLLNNKIFRRDQIWFTEKDRKGETHLYSLAEFKVRNDASFEKDYIAGRFGAIPFVGDLEKIFSEQASEQENHPQ